MVESRGSRNLLPYSRCKVLHHVILFLNLAGEKCVYLFCKSFSISMNHNAT